MGGEDQKPRASKQSANGRLLFAISAAALGSAFQHGYNTGVVNAPQSLIESWISDVLRNRSGAGAEYKPEPSQVTMIWSIAVSIFCVGGMIGGSLTGLIAEKLGRKYGLLYNNILVLAGCLLQQHSKNFGSYEMFIAGRFFIGVNCGLNAGLVPMYLSEISPMNLRGAVGTVYQLVVTISILISQIFGLKSVFGTAENWPLLFEIALLPSIFQVITLPFCPESPRHTLLHHGLELQAQKDLSWFRGTIEVHDEMEEMKNEYEAMKLTPQVTIREMLSNAQLRIPLFIAAMVMVCQQLSGINAVMFFSTKIFKMAQLSDEAAQYSTLGMGSMNVLMTLISLVLVEKAGRKTLLLIGFSGMFVDTVLLTICLAFVEKSIVISYFCILLVIVFVVMFAVGPGSIPWFLVSELFNQSARPTAASIAVAVNWTANFMVGLGFLPLQEALGSNVFVIFAVLLGLFVLFVWKKVPETKNKTMEEISSMFRQISYQ
ncbi:solute carrier family 2, facilitated glucose transporter member 1 isoform X2 [Bemisia tabaci]|uniref:Sugar transporter BTST111 n=1 Tax=Bemisia tabaci TaxID=7038 RepID=A0A1Z1XG24_BEMTA|nr:PREDICTED: solute carrier family 2, facilitated glucose transporter member 1-like isoform X2 [Bemisia tabaci]ARX98211.1 sugar transporter BTST111 [Bemisia tabaci]